MKRRLTKTHTDKLVGKTEIRKYADKEYSLSATVGFEDGTIKDVALWKWYKDMSLDLMLITKDHLPVLVEVLRELIDVLGAAND